MRRHTRSNSRYPCRPQPLRCAIAVALALASLTAVAQSHPPAAAETAASRTWDIPAAPLADTLARIARDSNRRLSADPALIAGKTAAPVRGTLSPSDAARQALMGTGLELIVTEGGTLSVRPAPARVKGGEPMLAPVTVRADAEQENAWGPVSGYAAKRSATVTKTDTPMLEIPQSISVIGRDEIETKGMREVLDTLNYTPGVFTRTYGRDDRGYEFLSIRGFESDAHNYLDGLAQLSFLDLAPMTEVYGMERVEVLRGPSSSTFGRGDVGGIVNRVSKRPTLNQQVREAQFQLGNFEHRQAALDFGEKLGDSLAFRVVGLTRRNVDQAKYPSGERAETQRHYFAPSLLWQPSAATSLTVLASVQKHEAGDDVGYVSDAAGRPTDVREGDPRYSKIAHKAWTLGYEFRHDFSDALGFRQKFRYADREVDKRHIRPATLQADGRTFVRGAVHALGDMQQAALDSYLEGKLQTGMVAHRLIAGVDWTHVRAKETERTGAAPDLDLLNPIYLPVTPPNTYDNTAGRNKLSTLGIYIQNQAKFGEQWLLTLSGRHDTARGEDASSWRTDQASSTHRAWSGRAALTWLAPNGFAPYLSYGTSFQPAFGAYDTLAVKPTEGKQWEAGIKFRPASGDLLISAAVFDLEKNNISVTNPFSGRSEQIGAVQSRGFEFEAKGKLMPGLMATASYTYNDIKGRKGDTWYVEEGKTPIQAPKMMASLWFDYTIRDSSLRGLNVGMGTRYIGKRWDDAANTKFQPGVGLVDAGVRYDIDSHWRLAVNATNLFDKRYYTSSPLDGWYRGELRALTATVSYRW